jgi:hypothetical protein
MLGALSLAVSAMAEIEFKVKREVLEIALQRMNGVLFMWVACAESALGSIKPSNAVRTTTVFKDYYDYPPDRTNKKDV